MHHLYLQISKFAFISIFFITVVVTSCGIEPSSDTPIVVDNNKCINCGICEQVCPYDAIHLRGPDQKPIIDPDKCTTCGACVSNCPQEAISGGRK